MFERHDSITDNGSSSQPASWKERERRETFGIWLAAAEWVPIASRETFLWEKKMTFGTLNKHTQAKPHFPVPFVPLVLFSSFTVSRGKSWGLSWPGHRAYVRCRRGALWAIMGPRSQAVTSPFSSRPRKANNLDIPLQW